MPGQLQEAARARTAWCKAVADGSPHRLRIELEDHAHGSKGKAVLSIGQHPLPGLVPVVARAISQTLEGIREEGLAEALQPVVDR
jgi:hypothetical protein